MTPAFLCLAQCRDSVSEDCPTSSQHALGRCTVLIGITRLPITVIVLSGPGISLFGSFIAAKNRSAKYQCE